MHNKSVEVQEKIHLSSSVETSYKTLNPTEQIQHCIELIQQKIDLKNVTGTLNSETDEVTFVIRQKHNGQAAQEDKEIKMIMDVFRKFESKITTQKNAISFWGDIHVTIKYENINKLIEALNAIENKQESSQLMQKS